MATHEVLGMDVFREGASLAFGVPYSQVTSSQRALFKERFDMFTGGFGMSREDTREQIKRVANEIRMRGGR